MADIDWNSYLNKSMDMANSRMRADQWGNLGGALGNYFAPWENPADSAMPTLQNIPQTMAPYYQHYIEGGLHPGERLNEIGSSFHQSPGFQFALQQALQGANHAAAAGGMAGSPQAQQLAMQTATGLADQDYNNYLNHAMGIYNTGYGASSDLAKAIMDSMLTQAQLQYEGANASNQHAGGGLGSLIGGGLGLLPGGPIGGAVGSALGGFF